MRHLRVLPRGLPNAPFSHSPFAACEIYIDVLVIFMDAYKQSRYHLDVLTDLETRMSWVYRRTGLAMGITSWTTCAAFLCTLTTPLPGLQSFGIFAALVIFVDYVLVMTMFCTAVIIYHNRYENTSRFGCCCPCGPADPNNTERARIALEESDGEFKREFVSEFFRTKVAGFIKVPINRLAIFVVFLTWMGVAIWQAAMIEGMLACV
jgi:predicted RND superfamily exporter protein